MRAHVHPAGPCHIACSTNVQQCCELQLNIPEFVTLLQAWLFCLIGASWLGCLRYENILFGQLLELGSSLPVIMFKQLLQLLSIECDALCAGVLLRQSLVHVEVVSDDLDTSTHNTLHDDTTR